MKKLLFLLIPMLVLLMNSCKKSDVSTNQQTVIIDTATHWKFNDTTYREAALLNYYGNEIGASCPVNGSGIFVTFKNAPTKNGTYNVIDYNGTPGDNECKVTARCRWKYFNSTGNAGEKVTVTIVRGYFVVTYSKITVKSNSDIATTSSGNLASPY